jgi:hypothetical protein
MQGYNESYYYAARAAKERAIADKATSPAIRQIHLELATTYELRAIEQQPSARRRDATGT